MWICIRDFSVYTFKKMNDVFLNSSNAPYVAELFFKFKENPSSIDSSWLRFFNSLNEDEISILKDFITRP